VRTLISKPPTALAFRNKTLHAKKMFQNRKNFATFPRRGKTEKLGGETSKLGLKSGAHPSTCPFAELIIVYLDQNWPAEFYAYERVRIGFDPLFRIRARNFFPACRGSKWAGGRG
jgi:hypothetical protein